MRYLFAFLFSLLISANATGQKVVLLEKFTNSKCGVCPNGAIVLQDLVDFYPNTVWVSHYKPWDHILNNDQSDQLWSDFGVYGNPLLVVDRENNNGLFNGLNSWEGIVAEELNEEQVATIEINNLYTNAFTRTIDFDCDISFLKDQENADYRITAMIVEDRVVGEPQSSYFNDEPGHPLNGLGSTIWNYEHRNVVRHIFDDAWGTADIISDEPQQGETASQHYQYQLEDDQNIDNMFIVCSITKYNPTDLSSIDALQAAQLKLQEGVITSTPEIDESLHVDIFPNPSSDFIQISSEKAVKQVAIYNATGQLVYKNATLENSIDVSAFTSGNYVVRMLVGDQWLSKQVSVVDEK